MKIAGMMTTPSLKPPKSPSASINVYTSRSYVFDSSEKENHVCYISTGLTAFLCSIFSMLKNDYGSGSA